MAAPYTGNLQQPDTCSVCFELVGDTNGRSTASLICGHQFHLDCIGSAFNAKGSMQCPNCRQIEDGNWLYANGRLPPSSENLMPEDEEAYEVDYEILAEVLFPEDWIMHNRWCPYERSSTEVSVSIRYVDPHLITHSGELVNRLSSGAIFGSTQPAGPPYVRRQSQASDGYALGGVEETAHRRHPGAPHQSSVLSTGQWNHQPSADGQPVGVVSGVGLQGRSHGSRSVGHAPPLQQRVQRYVDLHPITYSGELSLGGVEESAHHRHPGAPRYSSVPSSGQWNYQPPADVQPVGVVGGVGLQGQSHGSRSVGHAPPLQQRVQRGQRQGVPTSTSSVSHFSSGPFGPMPSVWGYSGASVVENATREAELSTNNEPRTNQQMRPTGRQNSAAVEHRWLPRFLSRMNVIPGSSTHEVEPSHPQGTVNVQSFQPYSSADDAEHLRVSAPSYPPGFP